MSQASAQVTITPRMMAESFWNMSDVEQAEFFEQLSDVIDNDGESINYGHGEAQWCWLADRLNNNPKAKEMACAMTAWIFVKFMQSEWRAK